MSRQKLPPTILKEEGKKKYPILINLYDFFSPRTQSITVWSIGLGSGQFEVEFSESTGSTVTIFDPRKESQAKFNIIKRVTETHETIESDPEWASILTNHWILPDTLVFNPWLPWSHDATLDISGTLTPCKQTKVDHIDFLKIDYEPLTSHLLFDILHKGHRPGLILINWEYNPDDSSITMSEAGHLQTLGYRLLSCYDNKYLYIFVNDNMYELCSWSETKTNNPMFDEFLKQVLNPYANDKKSEE